MAHVDFLGMRPLRPQKGNITYLYGKKELTSTISKNTYDGVSFCQQRKTPHFKHYRLNLI